MDSYEDIASHFQKTIEVTSMAVDSIAGPIQSSARLISESLLSGYKIMACGFGSDAALAQLFVSQSHSFLKEERPGLPMLALPINEFEMITSLSDPSDLFSPALKSLGQEGDILFCIDSNLNTPRLTGLIKLAASRKIRVVILSHALHAIYRTITTSNDVCILPKTECRMHLIELTTISIQIISSIIDNKLFGVSK